MSGSTDTGRTPVHFGNLRASSQRLFNHAKRERALAKRRQIAGGFPVTQPFHTTANALAYLAEPLITCLLCGREMSTLARHLRALHALSAREYKARYNLPLSRGLCVREISSRLSESAKRIRKRYPVDMNQMQSLRLQTSTTVSEYMRIIASEKPKAPRRTHCPKGHEFTPREYPIREARQVHLPSVPNVRETTTRLAHVSILSAR